MVASARIKGKSNQMRYKMALFRAFFRSVSESYKTGHNSRIFDLI